MEVTFNPQPTLEIDLATPSAMEIELVTPTGLEVNFDTVAPKYDGEYLITPTEEVQVLSTKDTRLLSNVTIGAIPSNYGRISWDGTKLTIS